MWLNVDTQPLIYTKAFKNQLQSKSSVSRSKKPHGQWLVDFKVGYLHEKKPIAFMKGFFLQRNKIRSNFQQAIKAVNESVSDILADLFDRYGRLKWQYKDHKMLKGTGVWADELDHGNLLIINTIYLDEEWADVALGAGMLKQVLEVTCQKKLNPAFILIDPTFSTQMMKDQPETENHPVSSNAAVYGHSIKFLPRQSGFRRIGLSRCFGFASDELHPSRELSADLDRKWDNRVGNLCHQFNISSEMGSEEYFRSGIRADFHLQKLATTHPFHWATMILPEDQCLQLYKDTKRNFDFARRKQHRS